MPAVSVTSYLKYLHSVSRRIVQRGGFHRIPEQIAFPCLVDPTDVEATERCGKFLERVRETLKKGEHGLFSGFGLVHGCRRPKSGRSPERILAPILFASAELGDAVGGLQEEGRRRRTRTGHTIAWESIGLNIDLLTMLLTGSAEFSPEEDEGLPSDSQVPQAKLNALADIEDEVDFKCADGEFRRALESDVNAGPPSCATDLFRRLLELFNMADEAKFVDAPCTPECFREKADTEGMIVHRGQYLFLSPVPSQLSTTVSLGELILQCETGGFESELLKSILESTLQGQRMENGMDDLDESAIGNAIDTVPLPLSACQRQALFNAWRNRVSYVQGPPGTGKSHTITALMLSALALEKRVLMVSHKPAAVAIVRDKLNQILATGDTAVMEAAPSSESRDRMKGLVQGIVQAAQGEVFRNERRVLEGEKSRADSEMRAEQQKRIEIIRDLTQELEREKSFHDLLKTYIASRNHFCGAYEVDEASLRLIPRPPKSEVWRRSLARASEVLSSTDGRVSRVDAIFLRRFLRAAAKQLDLNSDRLRSGRLAIRFVKDYGDLTDQEDSCRAQERSLDARSLRALRASLERSTELLRGRREDFLRLAFQLNARERASSASTWEQLGLYAKSLSYVNPRRLDERMDELDVTAVTATLPLWVGEMRHLGRFLPFKPDLFDLVIVDESSQVNIAEIIPAIARGARLCVVGDTKQLGLDSAGLFSLNQKFEMLCWNRAFNLASGPRITIEDADRMALRVSKHSILDFITTGEERRTLIPPVTLNEHFRSIPKLASFTSSEFYKEEGGLILMRERAGEIQRECFKFCPVGGKRSDRAKVVAEEVTEVVNILNGIFAGRLSAVRAGAPGRPSIGVLSFVTDQARAIRERVDKEFDRKTCDAHALLVGTTEEFQGNERNIMLITMGLGVDTAYAKSFYENRRRFNVATSRATDFTFVIAGAVPKNAELLARYLRGFGVSWTGVVAEASEPSVGGRLDGEIAGWTYKPEQRESEFERRVDEYLNRFIQELHPSVSIRLYNQVTACGQKRLDFVLHNESNNACCAVEVDGPSHFLSLGQVYSEEHLERVDTLRRAGWKIVHVPYYEWYRDGWLCDHADVRFRAHADWLFKELRVALDVP